MKIQMRLAPIVLGFLLPSQAFANHGPATSAGGVSVESAEPVPAGETSFVLRETYTSYENLSRAEIESRAASAGEFDYLDESFITTLGMSYGVTDNFVLSASLGWYSGQGYVAAEGGGDGEEDAETSVGNPSGLTDLAVLGKLRVFTTTASNVAILGGFIAPTGEQRERLSNGSTLEPSSQPGTGRFGFQGGLAFTHSLTRDLSLSTSSLYTHRLERDDVRIGDRLDTGLALSLQVTEPGATSPRLSFFGELNHIWLDKNGSDEGRNENSGGTSLFFTAGVRFDVNDFLALTLAPSVPLYQDSNGDQVEVDYKLTGVLLVRL